MTRLQLASAVAMTCLLSIASTAGATVSASIAVSPAEYRQNVVLGNTSQTSFTSGSLSIGTPPTPSAPGSLIGLGFGGGGDGARTSIGRLPSPSVSAEIYGGLDATSAQAVAGYYFVVTLDPSSALPVTVPLVLTGSTDLSFHGYAQGNAVIRALPFASPAPYPDVYQTEVSCGYNDRTGCGVQAFSMAFLAPAGSLNGGVGTYGGEITLDASAYTLETILYGAKAVIDPVLSIDPTFLAANPTAVIRLSQGIGNDADPVSSAPEPASWTLMIAAVAIVGGVLRRLPRNRPFAA